MANEGTITLPDDIAQEIVISSKIKELDILATYDIFVSTDCDKSKDWLTALTRLEQAILLPANTPFHIGKFFSENYEAKNNGRAFDRIFIRRATANSTIVIYCGVSW